LPSDCVGQPEGIEAQHVEGDEELQELGPRRNQGTQHLRRQAAGSGDHTVRRRGHLLWPQAIRERGKGAQGGFHLPEHLIDAPRGAGSRRRRQGQRRIQGAPRRKTPKGQGAGGSGAARFAVPRIGAPRRRGPPAPGVHRAGTFSLFLLPGGRPRRFAPELVPAAAEEADGSIGLGVVEEEVALEEEGEVSEVSRRLYLRGAAGAIASNPSAGTEALAQRSAAKRRAIMTIDASGTAALPAVSSRQL
jgi:hypothetical protein